MKKLLFFIVLILFAGQNVDAQTAGEKFVKIKITSGNKVIFAQLNDSAPAQDLLKRLPMTLNMNAHQNREYYANIRLDDTSSTQDGYQIGDIAYWPLGNSLILFYDKGYTSNLIIMGKITSGLDLLSDMRLGFSAKIEKIED